MNDLAQRMHALHQIALERPQLIKVLSKADADSPELAYMNDILFTFAHVFHMRQRKVLSDNELDWLVATVEEFFPTRRNNANLAKYY